MRDAYTGDDCRIPEDDRYVREVVEQPHSCAEQERSQIDVDLVEQSSVQTLLDCLAPVHAHGLRAGSRFRLATALSMPSVTMTCSPAALTV